MRLQLVFLHIFALVLMSQFSSSAQTYISPTMPDSLLVSQDSITTVSCDMLECPVIGGQLFAVGYSYIKDGGRESWIHAKYKPANGPIVSWSQKVPSAYNIQVALGDQTLTPGYRYVLFFVYNQDSAGIPTVRYSRYGFYVGPGGFSAINNGGGTSWGPGLEPKVDVFPNTVSTFSGGTPKMHDFVATWKSADTFLNLATGYINNSTTIVHHKIPIGMSLMPSGDLSRQVFDVSAQYDQGNSRKVAHILYGGDVFGTNWLRHAAIDMSVTTPAVLSIDTLVSDTIEYGNKYSIESPGIYNGTTGGAAWGALALDITSSGGATEVVHYNSFNNYGQAFTAPLSFPQYSVPIAVGLGLTKDTNKIGNENFITGWRDGTANNYYSQYVNLRTGQRDNPTTYYDICSTNTTPFLDLSSSSNGGNNTLAAWWDGTDIYWKMTDNLIIQPSLNTYISPTLPDNYLVTQDSMLTVSNDMLECPVIGGQLSAVGYSYIKNGGYESWIHAIYKPASGPAVTWDQKIPSAYNIQVALGDQLLTPGYRYILFFVYNQDSSGIPTVRYSRYGFYVGSGGFSAINNGGGTSWGPGLEPKVDVFANTASTFSGGTPKMHDFVATWKGTDTFLNLATGYINNSTTVVHHKIPIGMSLMPSGDLSGKVFDVSAQYDNDNSRNVAHVLYGGDVFGTNWLRHAAIDMSAITPAVISIDTLVSDTIDGPKYSIESPGIYNGTTGGAAWGALALDFDASGGATEVVHYNSFNDYGQVFTIPVSLPAPNVPIAVGLGLTKDTNKIGNENFITGWQDGMANNFYSQYVNLRTGQRNDPNTYYDICSTNTTALLDLSSSSNGGDNVMALWWDGTDIYWKVTSNTVGYKPADVETISSRTHGLWSVHPNPVTDLISIAGAENTRYSILDMTGRSILCGTLATPGTIKVSELATGMYLLQLSSGMNKETIKFYKQ